MTVYRVVHLRPGTSPPDAAREQALLDCLEIRREVFVEGQSVPIDREIDGLDREAEHFLVLGESGDGDRPVGTARLRVVEGRAKVERVAVLELFRGMRLGQKLMEALESRARECKLRRVVLNAQVEVIPFYEKLGYRTAGSIFEDAGIPHRSMHKTLD